MDHMASCVCGNLRVTAEGDPDFVVACNCTECQKRTGSPFGLGAYYPKSRVSIEGETNSYERKAESGRKLANKFCPNCGAAVYWTLEMRPDHLGIAVGCFTDPDFMPPSRVIWTKHQHRWMLFPEDIPAFPDVSPKT